MSNENKIVCVLELTEVEVQALRALIGKTGGGPSEPNDALLAVYGALCAFHREQRIPMRYIEWNNNSCGHVIRVMGWES